MERPALQVVLGGLVAVGQPGDWVERVQLVQTGQAQLKQTVSLAQGLSARPAPRRSLATRPLEMRVDQA
ncbi:hypothetical protein ACFL5O_08370 [Myxococcota bacterium]